MIESISDFLSIGVTVFFILFGFYILFTISDINRQRTLLDLEERYYKYYDNADDYDSDSNDEINIGD